MNELVGKKSLVTGGSRGIGAAKAIALAERGADVAVTYKSSADAAAKVAKEIEALGQRALALEVDAADAVAVAVGVRRAADHLGGLDILVNNAGVGAIAPITDLTLADLDRVLAVNVRGVYAAAQIGDLALDRFGTTAEVAAAITYLAGPSAAYITGTELTIDGGHTA